MIDMNREVVEINSKLNPTRSDESGDKYVLENKYPVWKRSRGRIET